MWCRLPSLYSETTTRVCKMQCDSVIWCEIVSLYPVMCDGDDRVITFLTSTDTNNNHNNQQFL